MVTINKRIDQLDIAPPLTLADILPVVPVGTVVANQTTLQDIKTLFGLPASTVLVLTSAPGIGGSPTEALTITGLLATDTILAVSQQVPGGNSLSLIGWSTLIDDSLTGIWAADPGAGSTIIVSVLR